MFKNLILVIAILISFASISSGQSTEAHFFGSVVSSGNQIFPEYLIEVLNRKELLNQNDTCIERLHANFKNRGEYGDSITWKTCQTKGEVIVSKKDLVYHQFKLLKEDHKGLLFGQKGTINVSELIDSLNNNSLLYQVKISENPRYWLIYNPLSMQIEYEMDGNKQLRSLKGFIFEDMLRKDAFKPMIAANPMQLKVGDRLQLVFKQTIKKPSVENSIIDKHLVDYTLHRIDTIDNIPYFKFSFLFTDLEFGTTLNNDTAAVGLFDEGIFIGNQIGIPYTELPLTFRRTDPSAENWINFLFPMEEVYAPYVETTYHYEEKLDDKQLVLFAFWNSNLSARITWLRDFPLPFREFEDYRAKVVYVKNFDGEIGKLYEKKVLSTNHFSFVNETQKGLDLVVNIPQNKGKFKIEVRNGNDSLITTEKNEFAFKKGENKLSFPINAKQPDQYYKLRLISVSGKNEKLEQEYYFISRYFN
jgi:hypothetical protein